MRPSSGVSKPATSRRVVVLPHPDGPSSAKNSPAPMSSDTLSSALMAPAKDLLSPWRLTEADPGRPADGLGELTGLSGTDVRSVGSKLLAGVIQGVMPGPRPIPRCPSLQRCGRLIPAQASRTAAPLQ